MCLFTVGMAISLLAATTILAETTLVSYAFGKRYDVTIPEESIAKAPAWKDDAENPPLSARKAIKLANDMKDSLVKDTKEFKWKLQYAALTPESGEGQWYWLIHYDAEFQGASSGVPNHLELAVLMDGTVIKPVVSVEK